LKVIQTLPNGTTISFGQDSHGCDVHLVCSQGWAVSMGGTMALCSVLCDSVWERKFRCESV